MSFAATLFFFYSVYDMFNTNSIVRKDNPHKYYNLKEKITIYNPLTYAAAFFYTDNDILVRIEPKLT